MVRRGPKPKGRVQIKWSSDFAYGIGLLSSDGNLSPDGRHIAFTSKDKELVELFLGAFNIKLPVGMKASASGVQKKYFVVQFSDVVFYRFLLSIGLTPNKSKTINILDIPQDYFFDFLRGVFDGDGSSHGYYDKRWQSSFLFYLSFASASRAHLEWLRLQIKKTLAIKGHVTGKGVKGTAFQLKYAKTEAVPLLDKMFLNSDRMSLTRKRLKIEDALRIIGESSELLDK